jgi:signal transduction histidine kinase
MKELEERRRLQGELDVASQQLTQAENMATLGMLMAGIAHDIRNPIQAVRGAGEIMSDLLPKVIDGNAAERRESAPLVHEALGWIEQGTRTMDAISLAMRNQSRGGVTEPEPMNLEEVVNEALVLCRSRTKLYQIETRLEPITIVGDATGVGQLVMNLVSNAADALAEQQQADWQGHHAILVEARVAAGEVRIGIHDSGPGVPEAIRSKILEPFFTTKPRGQGTGLGLAIVQRVVRQHGGTLTIERSDALGGALFLARWPHAVASAATT